LRSFYALKVFFLVLLTWDAMRPLLPPHISADLMAGLLFWREGDLVLPFWVRF
jgi:hypothetical protein